MSELSSMRRDTGESADCFAATAVTAASSSVVLSSSGIRRLQPAMSYDEEEMTTPDAKQPWMTSPRTRNDDESKRTSTVHFDDIDTPNGQHHSITKSNTYTKDAPAKKKERASARLSTSNRNNGDRHTNKQSSGRSSNPKDEAAGPTPRKCKIDLLIIFTLLCVLVAGAFSTIVAVADVSSKAVATQLAEKGASAELLYAGARVSAVMLTVEQQLVEYRERFSARRVSEDYPCGGNNLSLDGIATTNPADLKFSDSYGFFFDTSLVMHHNSVIRSFAYVNRTDRLNFSTPEWTPTFHPPYSSLAGVLNQCAISRTSIYHRSRNVSITSRRLPKFSELNDLDFHLDIADESEGLHQEHEDSFIQIALGVRSLTWMPYIRVYRPNITTTVSPAVLPNAAAGGLSDSGLSIGNEFKVEVYFVATAPVSFVVTNLTTGHSSPLLQHNTESGEVVDKYNVFGNRIDIMATIAVKTPMRDFFTLMRSITPDARGAHTSLYDLTDWFLLATSAFGEREAIKRHTNNGASSSFGFSISEEENSQWWLYTAKHTPSRALNEAFEVSGVASLKPGDVRVQFGTHSDGLSNQRDEVVVSAYVFQTPLTKNKFGVIQSVPRDYFFSKLDSTQKILISLGVACAVTVVIVCVSIFICIRLGLSEILENMKFAAVMKNHKVKPMGSILGEVDLLAKGFTKMNDQLLLTRPFLPQHMLLTSSSDEGGENEAIEKSEGEGEGDLELSDGSTMYTVSTNRSSTQVMRSGATTHSRENRHEPKVRSSLKKDGAAATTTATVGLTAITRDGSVLTIKRVTILALNVRGFHTHSTTYSMPSTIGSPTEVLTDLVTAVAIEFKAVVDSFHGDRFVISFNAVKNNAEGPSKAAQAALKLMRTMPKALKKHNRGNNNNINSNHYAENSPINGNQNERVAAAMTHIHPPRPLLIAAGIATGRACVGSLGCDKMKRLSIIGPVYGKAVALQRVCSQFQQNSYTSFVSSPTAIGENEEENIIFEDQEQDEQEVRGLSSIRLSECKSARIQCLVDKAMAVELQSSFLLQALGGLYGAPFGTIPIISNHQQQQKQLSTPSNNTLAFANDSKHTNLPLPITNININNNANPSDCMHHHKPQQYMYDQHQNNNSSTNNNNACQHHFVPVQAFASTSSIVKTPREYSRESRNNNMFTQATTTKLSLGDEMDAHSNSKKSKTSSHLFLVEAAVKTASSAAAADNNNNSNTSNTNTNGNAAIHTKNKSFTNRVVVHTSSHSPTGGSPLPLPPPEIVYALLAHLKYGVVASKQTKGRGRRGVGQSSSKVHDFYSSSNDDTEDDNDLEDANQNNGRDEIAGDEWLYELENAGGNSSTKKFAADINSAVVRFITSSAAAAKGGSSRLLGGYSSAEETMKSKEGPGHTYMAPLPTFAENSSPSNLIRCPKCDGFAGPCIADLAREEECSIGSNGTSDRSSALARLSLVLRRELRDLLLLSATNNPARHHGPTTANRKIAPIPLRALSSNGAHQTRKINVPVAVVKSPNSSHSALLETSNLSATGHPRFFGLTSPTTVMAVTNNNFSLPCPSPHSVFASTMLSPTAILSAECTCELVTLLDLVEDESLAFVFAYAFSLALTQSFSAICGGGGASFVPPIAGVVRLADFLRSSLPRNSLNLTAGCYLSSN